MHLIFNYFKIHHNAKRTKYYSKPIHIYNVTKKMNYFKKDELKYDIRISR